MRYTWIDEYLLKKRSVTKVTQSWRALLTRDYFNPHSRVGSDSNFVQILQKFLLYFHNKKIVF